MKIKKRALIALVFITTLFQSTFCSAELLANGDAFLYGANIEVGIGSDGAFGSKGVSPSGKSAGKRLGYISDPSGNKFQNGYHGDFFLPGYPEEGWGIRINGKNYNNNRSMETAEIIGNLSGYKATEVGKLVNWKGSVEGLEIIQAYRIYNAGISIIFDVSLKNTTSVDMTDVYYMRTVDPDNNAEQHEASEHALDTTNAIAYQGGTSNGGSSVTASQADGSFLELGGYSENSRVSFGGQFNRDPSEVFNGSSILRQSGSNTADESISIAYKFPLISAGDKVTFRIGYQLANVPKPKIDIDIDNSSGSSGNKYKQTYQLGATATSVVDSDISITGSSFTLLAGANIIITNSHQGDNLVIQGELPAGIKVDTNTLGTEVSLTGITTIAAYKKALQQIIFSNLDLDANIEQRTLMIQVVDENYTPSKMAESIIDIVIPVTLDNEMIATDDIINEEEKNSIILTGKSAANAVINLIFTDKDGQHIIRNIIADSSGRWSITNNPIDVTKLSDGAINVSITANSGDVQTNLTKTIQKDTSIVLTDIKPEDGEYISSATPVFRGITDPEANVSIKLANGKEYTIKADVDGQWKQQLLKHSLGETIVVTINAKDAAGNEKKATHTIKIRSLVLTVNDLETDAKGVAISTNPMLSGMSQSGVSIKVRVAISATDEKICSTTTDSKGNWSCQLPVLKSGGPYDCRIEANDHDGNSTSVVKEIFIPDLPLIIVSPVNNAVISGINPVFSGTSSIGTKVVITAATGQSCSAITDNNSHWSCTLASLTLDKEYIIDIENTDNAGNKVTRSIAIKTNKLPLSIQPLGEKNIAASTTPTLMGTSMPGTKISILLSTGHTCITTTDSLGNWLCTLPKLPVGGPYDVSINAVDGAGNKTTITQAISIPEIPLVIISPIAGAIIKTSSITLSGTSTTNTIITVLGPDGQRCIARTDDYGVWSCKLENLRVGLSKFITVISGNKQEGEKTVLLPIEIANGSSTVKTVTGGGSSSLPLFVFLGLLVFIKWRLGMKTQ